MIPSKQEPALSVVVVTRDHFGTLRPIIGALRTQTIADQIELVIAAPRGAERGGPPPDLSGFHSAQVVEVGPVTNRGRAAASGVLAAKAAIVALTENHCFPTATWGEQVVASHAGGWAGVGPAVENANPESALSQAMHAFGYGRFHRSGRAGPVEELALHNSSFRKAILPNHLATLEELFADERRLHRALRVQGQVLRFEPAIVKLHLNEATWSLLFGMTYDSGRRYAGTRSADWPLWRRGIYAAASPLLSAPIFRNIWRLLPPKGEQRRGLPLAAVICCCAVVHALGEAGSYLLGPKEDFPFVEEDEFMIRERLGGRSLTRPEVASFVALLDRADTPSGR